MKAKVESVTIGNYDVDSIFTSVNGKEIQICFTKDINVGKYIGTEIELIIKDGTYTITDITKK